MLQNWVKDLEHGTLTDVINGLMKILHNNEFV